MTLPFDPWKVLKTLTSRGGEYGEIFFENLTILQVHSEDGNIEKIIPGHDRGVGLRLIKKFRTYYGWTNSMDEKELLELASNLSRASGDAEAADLTFGPGKRTEFRSPPKVPAVSVEIGEKISLIKAAFKEAKASELIKNVRITFANAEREILIINTEGTNVKFSQPYILLAVQVVAEKNGVLQRGYETLGGTMGMEIFEKTSPEEIARKAAGRALLMVDAKRAPGGRMPVVISSEAGGTMIHEAVGHGLEADLASGNLSVYTGKLGEVIASPLVTVVDDPTIPGKRGSYLVDDEGANAGKTILVENGVLVKYMCDRLHHMKEGFPLTGNGRRESYRHRPIPRMSNTYIAPGTKKPEEIIHSVHRGLFVRKMGGGQVNTVTGDFVFEVQEGYLIENGKVGEPVRGATLTGNGPEVLKMIDMVGNDLGFGLGTCGKDGQGVPVGDAQPTIRIGEPFITVGGEG